MTASLRVVLVLFGLSLLALALTNAPIYFRLSYLWGFVLVVSWAWAALALRGVKLQRQPLIRRAQVGQLLEERFEIHNSGRLPRLWVEVRDQSALLGSKGSRVFTYVKGGQRQYYRVRTRLIKRGVFLLGPTELLSGDVFGLFPVNRSLPAEDSLLVYPITVEVSNFFNPPGLLPGGEALRRRTHQVTPNASGVREYVPGDSMNRIHWLSTARRNHLMAKEFELDPLADVWIFLDAARDVQAALPYSPPPQSVDTIWHPWTKIDLPPSTEEYAVSTAASLGRYFLRRGRAVGLVSSGQGQSPGKSLDVVHPDRGGRQLGKILEALALVRAEGDLPISALLTAQARHLPRGSTLVLITPSVQQEVALAVDVLLQRGVRPVVILLEAASFGGPEGTRALAAAIGALGVPVCRVANGADLGVVLSMNGTR